jgi:virulence factor
MVVVAPTHRRIGSRIVGDEQRLRVGIIGLGDIAAKAYLPALGARTDIELKLCTRNADVLTATAVAYRIEHRYANLAALVDSGIDAAFVHVATAAHVEIVSELLRAGVPTYVDKPLAGSRREGEQLVELARANSCSLFVGFNRRFAPLYRDAVDSAASLVFMQKNRVGLPDTARNVVFDDFIHVVDTLRFLAPQAEFADAQPTFEAGRLQALVVRLVGGGVTAIGAMNRNGGYTQESLETHGPGFRRVVREMAEVDLFHDGRHCVTRREDWTSVQAQRGFDAICAHFLDAVAAGRLLDAGDALRTHEICELIVEAVEA